MTALPPLTRNEMHGLLAHYRLGDGDHVSDDQVTVWLRELRRYSAAECHAALSTLSADKVTRATPAQIAGLIDHARSHPARTGTPSSARPPAPRDWAANAAAGARGIAKVYAAMGWTWNADHVLARTVPCPFCKALSGQVCGPLSRNREGKQELRNPITRMHPSRLEAARKHQATKDNRGQTAPAAAPQGAHA